jgi:nitrogen fixation NifU-like protein
MSELYREEILDHYKNPRNFGAFDQPDRVGRAANSLCGDMVEMQLKLEGNLIKEVKFRGVGCAISTAAASMLTEMVKGKKLEAVKTLGQKDVLKILGIALSPTRLKCALLPLEALHKSLRQGG